jgi:hypothetical protein
MVMPHASQARLHDGDAVLAQHCCGIGVSAYALLPGAGSARVMNFVLAARASFAKNLGFCQVDRCRRLKTTVVLWGGPGRLL